MHDLEDTGPVPFPEDIGEISPLFETADDGADLETRSEELVRHRRADGTRASGPVNPSPTLVVFS